MTAFTSIKVEAYIGSSWVDLTDDVIHPISGFWGIGGTSFTDRLADVGTLRFQLNNSASNSGGVVGYYSPEHASALSGWGAGVPIRLEYKFDGYTRYHRYYIDPDGIQIDAGTLGSRRVTVTCSDWMRYASKHTLDLMTSVSSKTIDQAVPLVLANMAQTPINTTLTAGASLFSTVFDVSSTETTALGEFQRLVMSEFGRIVLKRDGTDGETLFIRGRGSDSVTNYIPSYSTDEGFLLLSDDSSFFLLADDASYMILNNVQSVTFSNADYDVLRPPVITYGKNLCNRCIVKTYPRKLDAAATTVLWTMENGVQVGAGATVTDIRGSYRDPSGGDSKINGTDFVTPVASTDYFAYANADGTGTNLTANMVVTATFGAAEVEISIENTGGTAFYTGGDILFQVRGRGVYIYDKAETKVEDTASITTYGLNETVIDWVYDDSVVISAPILANAIITGNDFKAPHTYLERVSFVANRNTKNMLVFMYAEPGDTYTFSETVSGVSAENHVIHGIEFEIGPTGIVRYSFVLAKALTIVDF